MSMTRIDPPMPVMAQTGKGAEPAPAMAHAWIDYGLDHDLIWLVAFDGSRQFWCIRNQGVRAVDNITAGRPPAGGREKVALTSAIQHAIECAGLDDDTVQRQIAAVEDPDWQPMREGQSGEMIRGYQCVKCGLWKQWPTAHACRE